MAPTSPIEAVFVQNLGLIDRITGALARRHGLSGDDRSEFASWIRLRLVEDNYAVLRKFRGESQLGTYLTVVISMLARDYRASRWGRWRPSVAARRHGPVAVKLETLVHRDGLPVHHAAESMRIAGDTTASDAELAAILARLPSREPLRPVEVGAEPLASIASPFDPERDVIASDVRDERRRAEQALEAVLARLEVDDRIVLRMHFWEGLTVAQISRTLLRDQKQLYKRIDRLLRQLREALVNEGISRECVAELVEQRDHV